MSVEFNALSNDLLGDFYMVKKGSETPKIPKQKGGSKPVRGGGCGDIQVHKKHIPNSGKK